MNKPSSEAEKADHSMKWREDKSIEKPGAYDKGQEGASSNEPLTQPSTSDCTVQERESFATPLPAKISKDICKGYQHQVEHPSVNETNNSEVASGFSTAPALSQTMQVEPHSISSEATSDSMSALLVNNDTSCVTGDISTDSVHETGVLESVGALRSRLSDLHKEGSSDNIPRTGEFVWSITKKDRWEKMDSYSFEGSYLPRKR